MLRLKPLLTFALCLIVLATSVTQAIARGQMASGQMVQLCAGGEAVTMLMDAQGNPVDPAQPCPDCLALTASVPPATNAVIRPIGPAQRLLPPAPDTLVVSAVPCACARGPPVLI